MKRARFTEEQIIGILHEAAGGGVEIRELSRRHGNYGADILPLEGQVWWNAGLRSQATEGARG